MGGGHQNDHKISHGGQQKITEDHDYKVACKEIGQTEGAHKGNNYSQDQLSMGGSLDRPILTQPR